MATITVIIASVLGTLALYPVYKIVLCCHKLLRRDRNFRYVERRFQYSLLRGTRITWTGGILILLYALINAAVLIYLRSQLERWAGIVATINSIPLFLGGRQNVVIRYFGLNAHDIMHCTVGMIVIIEGFLHAALAAYRARLSTSIWVYIVRSHALTSEIY